MLKISSIVIASDLTKRSTLALQRAVRLKKQLGANLTLRHVVDGAAEPAQTEERRQRAKELLQAQVRSVCEVERPVLVVRQPADSPYQRLFCPFDGSPAACRALTIALSVANEAQCLVMHANEFPILAELATRRAGDVVVQRHIKTVMTELRAALQRLAPLPAEPQVRVVEGNAHFLIPEHMRDFSPDLVALGTHARSPAVTAFLGSLARDLLADTDCDVLIAAPERV